VRYDGVRRVVDLVETVENNRILEVRVELSTGRGETGAGSADAPPEE